MAKRFKLDKSDGGNLLKVLIYTVLTSIVVGLIAFWTNFDLPVQLLWLSPLVNTLLVAIKKYFEDKSASIDNQEAE